MKTRLGFCLLVLTLAVVPSADAKSPPEDLFGIYVGLEETAALERLEKIATLDADKEGLKQSWRLKDSKYGFLAVRYGNDGRVKWVTAFTRPDARPVKYKDIGKVKEAECSGRYIYTWSVPAKEGRAGYVVTAKGSDPDRLSTVSLSPLPLVRPFETTAHLPDSMWVP